MSGAGGPDHPDEPMSEAWLADWVAKLAEQLEAGRSVDWNALAEAHPDRIEEVRRLLPTIRRMALFGQSLASPMSSGATFRGAPDDSDPGSLGDFRLTREVGRGGMGIVYEAEQISLGRRVALKVLPFAATLDPRQLQRFRIEAQAAACLHHTNIVPVHAVGTDRGVPYFAMHYVEGQSLAEVVRELRRAEGFAAGARDGPPASAPRGDTSLAARLRSGRLGSVPSCAGPDEDGSRAEGSDRSVRSHPLGADGPSRSASSRATRGRSTPPGTSTQDRSYVLTVVRLILQAAEALDHAHSRGVLHRDVKPANVMLGFDGHLWVTDFGLARIQGRDGLTLTGDVLGTLRYMSPEQALARRVVLDGRTDIYSLGATLYELLTLRPVFDGADRAEILRRIAQEEPIPPRRLNPAVPPDLETIVLTALAKDLAGRYPTARDLADDLRRFLELRPIHARRPSLVERAVKWVRRNRALVLSGGLFVILGLLGLVGGLLWSNRWLSSHNLDLQRERDRVARFSGEARRRRELALYAVRVRQGAEELKAGRFESAQEILRDLPPDSGEADLREFAWRYLWRESRREVAVLSQRTERVLSLAVAPDGRTVATGDRDGTILLRDAATGDVRVVLRGHRLMVVALAFTPDGRTLASGAGEFDPHRRGEVFLWDVATGRRRGSLDGFERRYPNNLRFDPSGSRLWENSEPEGGTGYEVGLWERLDAAMEAPRPRLRRRWTSERNFPTSADGRLIAAFDAERQLTVRETDSDRVIWRAPHEARGYQIAAISRDGSLVAAVVHWQGRSPALAVWEIGTGRELVRRGDIPAVIVRLEFGADGRSLLVRNDVGATILQDLAGPASWTIPADPTDRFMVSEGDALFSPDGHTVAWSYAGRATGPRAPILYERLSGEPRLRFLGRVELTHQMRFFPDGRSLVFESRGRAVHWRFESATPSQPIGHTDEAWAVAFAPDGRLLATGSDDTDEPQTLKLWEVATGRQLSGWKAHGATVAALAIHPGGRLIASAALDTTANLRLWDLETGRLHAQLDGHTDKVRGVAFSPDGLLLASAGADRAIRLWDVVSGRLTRVLSGHGKGIRQVAFAPDGRTLASAGTDSTVRLWDVGRGEEIWSRPTAEPVSAVAFSPDGHTLAWADEAGVVSRWDLIGGGLLEPLLSGGGEIRCLAFEPGGRTLALAGRDGSVHLWDPAIGQELLTIPGRPRQINGLAFAPDASALAACSHDGSVRFFRAR